MKPHPELTATAILKELLKPELLPDRVGGGGTMDERVESKEALLRMAHESLDKIRTLCIGCGIDVPLLLSQPCVCGGFVCADCVLREGSEACDHEPPMDPELLA